MENETTSAGMAPYLAKLSEKSWLEFVEALEAYRGRGGKRELKALVAPAVQAMFADQGVEELTDDSAVAEISKVFAPASISEAHARFRRLRAQSSGAGRLEDIFSYNLAWVRAVRVCPDSVRPSETVMVGQIGRAHV